MKTLGKEGVDGPIFEPVPEREMGPLLQKTEVEYKTPAVKLKAIL